ncbi:hypothetical protein, partial [Chlamydia trachomatis]
KSTSKKKKGATKTKKGSGKN